MSSEDFRTLSEEELKWELEHAERLMEIIDADPELRDLEPPADMYEKIMAAAREYQEQEKIKHLSREEKELIRLEKIYRRCRRWSRCAIIFTSLVAVMGLGSVSMGENQGIFSIMTRLFSGGDRIVINSQGTEPIVYKNENEIYEDIEVKFGFKPVRLGYIPKGISFQEATLCDALQVSNLIYGTRDTADVICVIRPNFRKSSFGTTIDDKKIQAYQMVVHDVDIFMTEYEIAASEKRRWAVQFEYQDVQYWLKITNMERQEVENIIYNLCFVEQDMELKSGLE